MAYKKLLIITLISGISRYSVEAMHPKTAMQMDTNRAEQITASLAAGQALPPAQVRTAGDTPQDSVGLPYEVSEARSREKKKDASTLATAATKELELLNPTALPRVLNELVMDYAFNPWDHVNLAGDPDLITAGIFKLVHDTLKGHTKKVNAIVYLDNNRLASCSDDTTIKIWDLNEPATDGITPRVTTLKHFAPVIKIIKLRNNRLASFSSNNALAIWDLGTEKMIYTLDCGAPIRSLIELHDGRIAFSHDKTVFILNYEKGAQNLTYHTQHTDVVNSIIELNDHSVASCSDDSSINLSNLITGRNAPYKVHAAPVKLIIKLNNGNTASYSSDKIIQCTKFNTHTDPSKSSFESVSFCLGKEAHSLVVLSNNILGALCNDGSLILREMATGKLRDISLHKAKVTAILELTGGIIASCSLDKTIKIAYVNDNQEATFIAHEDAINSIIPLNEGQFASCSDDATIKIWGFSKAELKILRGAVFKASIHADSIEPSEQTERAS